ncbi:Protein Star [Orchesella cincta]|uniref:Protein Star n=1 Tax=Orchesella cincta TaxID=48709 RepID=A0A1D2MSZ0_ORCCI|nr:Protein Star [Orchesella cincta]
MSRKWDFRRSWSPHWSAVSHTLMLEIQHNWTGLLVECNPTLVPILRQRHRKAWIADVCLSPAKVPRFSNFFNDYNYTQTGRLETSLNKVKSNSSILYEVYSIPLYTLVTALGYKEIDFFALDVEGAEMEILLTIPFDLLTIKVLTVEELSTTVSETCLGKWTSF